MPNPVIDNFDLKAEKFNFERDCFDTLAKMKAFPEAGVPDQFATFCLETKKAYRIDKSNNVDSITGKWREVEYVNIEIGSLKKLPYGSVPTVTNTGIGTTPILNFGIPEGAPGPRGPMGSDGSTWKPSVNQYGYLSWSLDSSTSAPEEYLVKGPQGTPGRDGSSGKDGADGIDGLSAYEIAVKNGFVGTEEEWLESLKGSGTGGSGLTEAQKTFLGVSGDLQTESKVSLPSAINEVAGEVQKVWNKVGTIDITVTNACYNEKHKCFIVTTSDSKIKKIDEETLDVSDIPIPAGTSINNILSDSRYKYRANKIHSHDDYIYITGYSTPLIYKISIVDNSVSSLQPTLRGVDAVFVIKDHIIYSAIVSSANIRVLDLNGEILMEVNKSGIRNIALVDNDVYVINNNTITKINADYTTEDSTFAMSQPISIAKSNGVYAVLESRGTVRFVSSITGTVTPSVKTVVSTPFFDNEFPYVLDNEFNSLNFNASFFAGLANRVDLSAMSINLCAGCIKVEGGTKKILIQKNKVEVKL